MPVSVMTNSPCARTTWPSTPFATTPTVLTGCPANLARKCSVHPTSNPQLAGLRGAIRTPRARNKGTQAASDPSCGQLPPPNARIVASATTLRGPSGVSKRKSPSASHPLQQCRACTMRPDCRNRLSQARSSGADFISVGKMRPEDPTNVSIPSPRTHARSASGPKAARSGSSCLRRLPYRERNACDGSEWVRFKPPFPAKRNLRPTDGMASNKFTCAPPAKATSAAIRPAGPPPIMATLIPRSCLIASLFRCEPNRPRTDLRTYHKTGRVGTVVPLTAPSSARMLATDPYRSLWRSLAPPLRLSPDRPCPSGSGFFLNFEKMRWDS